jgi:hypothetical protein
MSISRDIEQLRSSGKLSMTEFSEFTRRLRGKSVSTALGTIAQSQLVRALAESTGVVAALIVVGTLPFCFMGESNTAAANTAGPVNSAAASPDTGTSTSVEPATDNAAAGPDLPATIEEAEKKLGLDKTATPADPKSNPLESKTDDLLKDLK